jgi:hypothetical protein
MKKARHSIVPRLKLIISGQTQYGPFVFGSVRSNDRKARWTIIGEFRS